MATASGARRWRTGWTVAAELARRTTARPRLRSDAGQDGADRPAKPTRATNGRRPSKPAKAPALSKDAYERRKQLVEDDLTRLGLRKSQLELALGDPGVQANFVELRRVTSELADVDAALAQAEDAWLTLAEQAPR